MLGRKGGIWSVLLVALSLAACAVDYAPYVVEVKDPAALQADLTACQGYARAYPHSLSAMGVAQAGAEGGAQNMAGAVVNPLVPVLGALGGATHEVILDLGALDDNTKKITTRCMGRKGIRSGAYLVIDPNPNYVVDTTCAIPSTLFWPFWLNRGKVRRG